MRYDFPTIEFFLQLFFLMEKLFFSFLREGERERETEREERESEKERKREKGGR